MSLREQVVELVREHGRISTDDLASMLHGYTRSQVSKAAQNLSYIDVLECVDILPRNGKAQGCGVWALGKRANAVSHVHHRPCASVWEYAMGRAA